MDKPVEIPARPHLRALALTIGGLVFAFALFLLAAHLWDAYAERTHVL